MSGRSKAWRIYCLALAILFGGAIAAPLPGLFTATEESTKEKRRLAPVPALPRTPAEWEALPDRLNAFINDHFGLRESLISLHSMAMSYLFHKSVSPSVIIGRAGWLYLGINNSAALFRNDLPFTDQDIGRWLASIRRRQQWLADRGPPYLLVVAPDKHSIYPEYMPSEMVKAGPQSQLDQLVQAAGKVPDLQILDLRPALLAAKAQARMPLYGLTDSHWNAFGAYVAYHTVMERLSRQVAGLRILDMADDAFSRRAQDKGDLATMLAIPAREEAVVADDRSIRCRYETTQEPVPPWMTGYGPLIRTRCPAAQGKLLVVRDSFATALLPYFSQSFGEVVYLWVTPEERDFAHFQALVDREKPDLVVEEWAERLMQYTPDPLSPPARPGPEGLAP